MVIVPRHGCQFIVVSLQSYPLHTRIFMLRILLKWLGPPIYLQLSAAICLVLWPGMSDLVFYPDFFYLLNIGPEQKVGILHYFVAYEACLWSGMVWYGKCRLI